LCTEASSKADLVEDDMDQTIDTTVRKVLEKRPILEALMKSFAAFYVEKNRVAGFLKKKADPNCLDISVKRVASGIPF